MKPKPHYHEIYLCQKLKRQKLNRLSNRSKGENVHTRFINLKNVTQYNKIGKLLNTTTKRHLQNSEKLSEIALVLIGFDAFVAKSATNTQTWTLVLCHRFP